MQVGGKNERYGEGVRVMTHKTRERDKMVRGTEYETGYQSQSDERSEAKTRECWHVIRVEIVLEGLRRERQCAHRDKDWQGPKRSTGGAS